jgi:hypothetical protein
MLVTEISKYAENQFPEIFSKCVYHSLNIDEPPDITSITQMPIFARDPTSDTEVFEELVYLHSMQGKTKG